jgi:alpha-ketoglutarate-dependent taurine dioxygenase
MIPDTGSPIARPSMLGPRRQPARVSASDLCKESRLDGPNSFAIVFEAAGPGVDLASWIDGHQAMLETRLLETGAILFRGFDIASAERFRATAQRMTPGLIDYRERAASRSEVSSQVYTSTEFPADQYIPLHHEMSYSHNWPEKIWFCCMQPAEERGATPIAQERVVTAGLPARITAPFIEKQVMYVRNFGRHLDLTWQEAFQTTDRQDVERYGAASGMQIEWLDDDRLRTRQVRQAVVRHPRTGEQLWFNHTHLFHVSSLGDDMSRELLRQFAPDDLPRHALYGDGSAIDPGLLNEIRHHYMACAQIFTWRTGDMLLLDNFLVAHGREPFRGPRRVLVAMADLYTSPTA